ncbi:unnamed protein product [Dracunculus medinensis]|uniref:Mab-21 domain-containing protein n=1 Tax=Dracunculus medinensis TaxID=318479 RepID=A0A0N4U5R8_DRAME|nr:unnamed protein product [Dracunculus medinensis]
MAVAVSKVGIPTWIVKVRHKATHQHMPSLKMFRKAARFCRQWLWIFIYRFRDFLDTLLLDGRLIMTQKQIQMAGFSLSVSDSLIWNIPETLQRFWQPVFHILSRVRALPELLYGLVSALDDPCNSQIRDRQLIAWIHLLLSTLCKSDIVPNSDWTRIIRGMLRVPQKYLDSHFEKVLNKLESGGEEAEKCKCLRQLVNIALGNNFEVEENETCTNEENRPVRTVEDLQKLLSDDPSLSAYYDANNGQSNWILCNANDWKEIPLGLTPEQTTESLCLIIDPGTL